MRGDTVQPRPERFVVFALITAALLVYAMQFSMVSVALPELIEDLDAPLSRAILSTSLVSATVAEDSLSEI